MNSELFEKIFNINEKINQEVIRRYISKIQNLSHNLPKTQSYIMIQDTAKQTEGHVYDNYKLTLGYEKNEFMAITMVNMVKEKRHKCIYTWTYRIRTFLNKIINFKNNLCLLVFFLFTLFSQAQLKLKPPTNNCAVKSVNSEVDACDLSKPQGDACLCAHYKLARKHNQKMSEYRSKRYSIDREIRNLGPSHEVNIVGLIDLTIEDGFNEEKQKSLNNLSKNKVLAQRGLALSKQKKGYCQHYHCADGDIKMFQERLERIRRDRIKIQNTKPKTTYDLSINGNGNSSNKKNRSSNNSDKEKEGEKKEEYENDKFSQWMKHKSKVRNDYQNAISRGDYRKASEIMDRNKDAFTSDEKMNAYTSQIGRDVAALLSYIPEAKMGYATLNYSLDQYTWGISADYNFIYPVEGFTGIGYSFGFGASWANNDYKSSFNRETRLAFVGIDDNNNGFHFDFSGGITIGNPEKFLIINTLSIKAHYRLYNGLTYYDENMTQAFNIDRTRKDNYYGEFIRGGRFGLGVDITFFKFLKAGIIMNQETKLKDFDNNTSFNTLDGSQINYNSIFTDKYSFYFGIVIAIR